MKNLTVRPQTKQIDGRVRRIIELSPQQLHMDPRHAIAQARGNRARAQFLTGRTEAGLPLSQAVMKYYDDVIAGFGDPKFLAERDVLMAAVAKKDPTAVKTLAGIRVDTFSNYLYAPANFLSLYCNIVNLAADERPVAERFTMQEVAIYAVGGDGAPNQVRINLDPDETLIPLGWLTSDIYRYRKVDVYRGRVVDPALATIKVAYDIGQYENQQVQALLGITGSYQYPGSTSTAGQAWPSTFFGPFTFTGKRANWPYVAHSTLNTGNLPTTNNVTVYEQDGVTIQNGFGFQTLAYIVDYCARWDGAFQDGVNLRPTGRIILPPGVIKQIMTGIFPSGATRNDIADELMEAGWFSVSFLGVKWLFIPDNTLNPNQLVCYPEFNQKPINVYHKPALDEEKTSEGDYQIESKNEEERYSRRVFGAYWDSSRRVYGARFWFDGTLHQ
jgi:hypothetical protein